MWRSKKNDNQNNKVKQQEAIIVDQLWEFFKNNWDWLQDYKDYADKFNTDMIERKMDVSLNNELENCSVLILTANAVEQNILTCKLYREANGNKKVATKLTEIVVDGCVYQFATVQGLKIVHIHPYSTSSFTQGGSANAVRNALERFRPKLVVSLGVAFGIDSVEQQLGEVILSSGIIPYDIFNKDKDGDIKVRADDKFHTHEALHAWDALLRNKWFSSEKELGRKSLIGKELVFQWKYGTMLSGGSVLSNEMKKQALVLAADKIGEEIIGGEMEGTGIYFECKKPDIPCIVIKGICDWGAKKNAWDEVIKRMEESGWKASNEKLKNITNDSIKDCVQAYAMDNATEALLRLLRFDSAFLNNYSKHLKSSKLEGTKIQKIFEYVKLNFNTKKKNIIQLAGIYLLLLAFFVICNFSMQNSKASEGLMRLMYTVECLFFISLICIEVLKKCTAIHPFIVRHPWVDFVIDTLDFETGRVYLSLNDTRPIFRVVLSCWIVNGKVNLGNIEIGDVKEKRTLNFHIAEVGAEKAILQIDYELANGDHYVHLISKEQIKKLFSRKKSDVYHERIFVIDGQKDMLVGARNVAVKRRLLFFEDENEQTENEILSN